MRILGNWQLRARVDRLRGLGVKFPKTYPPPNLPLTSEWFRSVLSQIETVELAVAAHPPDRIIVEPQKPHGDVDILIDGPSKYRLQIMDWIPNTVRTVSGTLPISRLTDSTRLDVIRRFQGGRKIAPALHRVRLLPHPQHGVVYSGTSQQLDAAEKVHMTVLEVAPELTNATAELKFRKNLDKAYRQLKGYHDSVLVPVCNLARYPHDQANLYQHARQLFSRMVTWRKLGGVLFITASHPVQEPISGFYLRRLRFIGVANPNAPASRRLDPYAFNPRLDYEEAYEESTVILSTIPEGIPLRVNRREIWIRDSYFGTLPRFLGQPLAVQMPKRGLKKSRGQDLGYALPMRTLN